MTEKLPCHLILNFYLLSTLDVLTVCEAVVVWGERHLGPQGVSYKGDHR